MSFEENEILFEKYFDGLMSKEELLEFESLLKDEQFAKDFNFFKQIKTEAILDSRREIKEFLKVVAKQSSQPNLTKRTFSLYKYVYPMAASLVILLSIGIYLSSKTEYNRFTECSKRGSYSHKMANI